MHNSATPDTDPLSAAAEEIKPRVLELMLDLSEIHHRTKHGDPWQPLSTIFALAADNHCERYWKFDANQRFEIVVKVVEELCREGLLLESISWSQEPIGVRYRYRPVSEL